MSVYSTQLYAGEAPSGLTVVYTVPSNQVAVIRDIEAYNASAGSLAFSISVEVSGSTKAFVWVQGSAGAGTWSQWRGRAVLPTGDELAVSTGGSGIYVLVSGYLLDA